MWRVLHGETQLPSRAAQEVFLRWKDPSRHSREQQCGFRVVPMRRSVGRVPGNSSASGQRR
jgi:hypothetical protein